MTYHELVQFAGTYGQLYMLALFVAGVAYALWPRNRDKFERAARQVLEDDQPVHPRSESRS
jgi:cytochrome c oxidase cbb3-type subunit 4